MKSHLAIAVATAAAVAISSSLMHNSAQAQSPGGDPYLGFVFTIATDFCPQGTAPTQGQLLPIKQNQALYSLLGTRYGGDGKTTFALPRMQGARTDTGAPLSSCIAMLGVFPTPPTPPTSSPTSPPPSPPPPNSPRPSRGTLVPLVPFVDAGH